MTFETRDENTTIVVNTSRGLWSLPTKCYKYKRIFDVRFRKWKRHKVRTFILKITSRKNNWCRDVWILTVPAAWYINKHSGCSKGILFGKLLVLDHCSNPTANRRWTSTSFPTKVGDRKPILNLTPVGSSTMARRKSLGSGYLSKLPTKKLTIEMQTKHSDFFSTCSEKYLLFGRYF